MVYSPLCISFWLHFNNFIGKLLLEAYMLCETKNGLEDSLYWIFQKQSEKVHHACHKVLISIIVFQTFEFSESVHSKFCKKRQFLKFSILSLKFIRFATQYFNYPFFEHLDIFRNGVFSNLYKIKKLLKPFTFRNFCAFCINCLMSKHLINSLAWHSSYTNINTHALPIHPFLRPSPSISKLVMLDTN